MRGFRAATLTGLHDKITKSLVEADRENLDLVTSVDVQIHNIVGEALSMEWSFDLKHMWLTPSRWSMMVNQYLDGQEVQAWIDRVTTKIGTSNRGIAVLRTKVVKPRGGDETGHTNKATRRWGSCMLGVSYKAVPWPQITLYSRTSYLGYIGALDLNVAYVLGKYLARELNVEVEDFRFCWLNEAVQWHNFKSLAFLLNHPSRARREWYRYCLLTSTDELNEEAVAWIDARPGMRLSRKWMHKVISEDARGVTYGDMTYNTYRRIRRRYHTEVHGLEYAQQFEGWSTYRQGPKLGQQKEFFKAYRPLPSTPGAKLDLARIGLPFGERYGSAFVGGVEDDMEDDDE